MINLIPNEEKKRKVRDFYFRLLVTFFTVFGFSIFIASFAILPAYFLSSVKENITNNKLEIQKKEPVPLLDQKTLDSVNDLKDKLNLIEKTKTSKYLLSQKIINEILLEKMAEIKITQILYENNPVQGKKISIQGTAPSREVLLLFRQALEDNPTFKSIDLPISNFIKGSNIQFYLSLIPS